MAMLNNQMVTIYRKSSRLKRGMSSFRVFDLGWWWWWWWWVDPTFWDRWTVLIGFPEWYCDRGCHLELVGIDLWLMYGWLMADLWLAYGWLITNRYDLYMIYGWGFMLSESESCHFWLAKYLLSTENCIIADLSIIDWWTQDILVELGWNKSTGCARHPRVDD